MYKRQAYQRIQGTKPQSLAFGVTDSPVGTAAWLVEKLRAWSDCRGNPENKFTKDQILTFASLYWFTRSLGTGFRYYYPNRQAGSYYSGPVRSPAPETANARRVPQGYFDFYGITSRPRPPKSLVDKIPSNVTL